MSSVSESSTQSVLLALVEYPLKFCSAVTLTTWILSLITGNVSQVDRLWTFLPTIYTAYWALLPLWPRMNPGKFYLLPYVPENTNIPAEIVEQFNPRALLMLGVTVTWMLRLSYNTWRRGLFSLSDEDYRWAVLRQKVPGWLFQVTNLVFIAGIQNVLLLMLGFPTFRAIRQGPAPLQISDYMLAGVALGLLAFEFTADNQQFAYHAWKHGKYDADEHWPGARLTWTEADRKRGFCTRGLWAWSRHPNFFAEQSFWCIINLFPLLSPEAAVGEPVQVNDITQALRTLSRLAPCISLIVLFTSSTIFTESISLAKYPEGYAAYQRRVSKFVPILTPICGAWLHLTCAHEERQQIEALVWGTTSKNKSD